MLVQAYEGPTIDVDTVIGVLMAEDLSPAALAALKADALGLSFKPPPLKKQPKGGKHTACSALSALQMLLLSACLLALW